MINIAVCDDDVITRNIIKKYLTIYSEKKNVIFRADYYENGEDLLLSYGHQYDVIFLDIEMTGYNGIQTAERIRQRDKNVLIAFLTSHEKYAFDSFSVDAAGYQTKPVAYEAFEKEMGKYISRMNSCGDRIVIENKGIIKSIMKSNIVYFTYHNHYLRCRMLDGEEVMLRSSIKEFLREDKEGIFVQIHSSYVINMIWIERCLKQEIYLKGIESSFPVSRHRWREFYKQYMKFCSDRLG